MPAHRNKRGGEIVELSPERAQKVAQAYVNADHVPDWRNDPTYNLRKPKLDRRKFLIGLFGTAAITAAGPIPKVLEKLPERDFIAMAKALMPRYDEVYGNGKDYAFATIKYLNKSPYLEIVVPAGYRPLRDESNRIGAEALARIKS
jgi:hypothetical protein